MAPDVAAFTDTYLPTVNGATYTIRTWRDEWRERGGRMEVVYPGADEYAPEGGEHPVLSVPFPFYEGYRFGAPSVPDALAGIDLVHAHTPFGVGVGGLRLARAADCPLVASYHTPAAEYAGYLAEGWLRKPIARAGNAYERWFLGRADHVIAPSETTRAALRERNIGPVSVVSNGVDLDRFAPTDPADFRARHDLPEGPLIGYTGRHGFEKRLGDLIDAAAGTDWTVVLGGDGPARRTLMAQAHEADVDARFLGFLDREELPAFYSALDAFGFPSPVETEGLVALEAMACGTPVVGVNAGALARTIDAGETGYHFERDGSEDGERHSENERTPPSDAARFRAAIERTLNERERLSETCLARRERHGVDHAVDRLAAVYETVLTQC